MERRTVTERRTATVVLVLCLALLLSGCYWKREVQDYQTGVVMRDGVTVTDIVGPGRYTDMGRYADLRKVDNSAQTLEWEDPDLWTSDKQVLGFRIGVTYRRSSDPEIVREMWRKYNKEMTNDEALASQIVNRIPRVAKLVTAQYTLDEMLGIAGEGRDVIQQAMAERLRAELMEFGCELLDIGINDIAADDSYKEHLAEKNEARIAVEVAQQRALQLAQQLEQERAQTEIDLEKARRENAVAEEMAKVYEQSDRAYELERLALLAEIMGNNDKLIFLPDGTDLSLLFGGEFVPVP